MNRRITSIKIVLPLAVMLFTHAALAQSTLYSNSTTNNVGIGTTSPNSGAALDMSNNTNSMMLPVGTTGQRPFSGANGMMRLNTTTPGIEAYYGGMWNLLGTGTGGVNVGTAGQIGYYASSGSTISGTDALPNGTTAITQNANDSSVKVATTAFANPNSSVNANGYFQLPSGQIIQYGSAAISSGSGTISFPTAFPNNVWSITVTSNTVGNIITTAAYQTLSGFTCYTRDTGNNNVNASIYWMAIGN